MRGFARTSALLAISILGASSALGQQRGQWLPGQYGLDAGVLCSSQPSKPA